jgi:predicted tellurium resistance membrane protein TerC
MDRFPVIVVLGAVLIGWVGGETIASDRVLGAYAEVHHGLHYAAAAAGAVLVFIAGKWLQRRAGARAG